MIDRPGSERASACFLSISKNPGFEVFGEGEVAKRGKLLGSAEFESDEFLFFGEGEFVFVGAGKFAADGGIKMGAPATEGAAFLKLVGEVEAAEG